MNMIITIFFYHNAVNTVNTHLFLDGQEWAVFREVSEILIMVPALLGLKGNLEMTLAARLSTAANIGHMDRSDRSVSA